ncbi:MAG: transcriptional regulator [Euryarchaeota archaeon]|nr:transcriptional regulator [Euryarchaeota archaeon]MBU4139990.1 transcriptional regulator [Euryarchaeota archaeon]
MASKIALIFLLFILLLSTVSAAPDNGYKTTYTINVKDDGTAVWYVEYRTQLVTTDDFDAFENYTEQLKPVYLNEFRELMQKSVSAASNATKREMVAGGFTGEARNETAPTGNYGVVKYSFTWTDFAKLDTDKNLNVGDVFVGGLYLSKDNTLIIQFPQGYTVEQVTPQPDMVRDGMIWYGLRSFNTGEPNIVLLRPSISWMLYALAVIILVAGAAIIFKIQKNKVQVTIATSGEGIETVGETLHEEAEDIAGLSNMMDLEDRIVALLNESGGSLYQSDIVKKLDLPKSTVSSALNGLHTKNTIQKIKKGRENLIRLAPSLDKI